MCSTITTTRNMHTSLSRESMNMVSILLGFFILNPLIHLHLTFELDCPDRKPIAGIIERLENANKYQLVQELLSTMTSLDVQQAQ